jgi:hypothetical protein
MPRRLSKMYIPTYIEQKRKQHSMPMLTCVPTSNHPMLLCIRRSDEPAVRVAMNQAMTRQKKRFPINSEDGRNAREEVTRVARFFSTQNTKERIKYTKLPNGHKIYQMFVK